MRKIITLILLSFQVVSFANDADNTALLEVAIAENEEAESVDPVIEDPLEGFNRSMTAFNNVFDKMILMPITLGYRHLVPGFLKTGIENFVYNAFSPVRMINFALQGDVDQFAKTGFRFIFNFFFGFFGFFDTAGAIGITAKDTNFGKTLAKWGGKPGPYVVLPVLGPMSARGMFGKLYGLPLEISAELSFLNFHKRTRQRIYWTLFALDLVDSHSKVLPFMENMMNIYDDKYIAIRSAVMYREFATDDE